MGFIVEFIETIYVYKKIKQICCRIDLPPAIKPYFLFFPKEVRILNKTQLSCDSVKLARTETTTSRFQSNIESDRINQALFHTLPSELFMLNDENDENLAIPRNSVVIRHLQKSV